MPITIHKAKEPVVASTPTVEEKVVTLAEMTEEQLADHYGSLSDQCEALMTNPCFNLFKLAKAELAERIKDQVPPEDGAEIVGTEWALEIGACAKNARTVSDVPAIAGYLGTKFYELAKVNISDLEKYLTPEQLAKVVKSDNGYGDTRKIKALYLGKVKT